MNYNALTGVISLLIGLVYSIQSFLLPKATVGNPMAPIYFPMGLGILMMIFGLILIIQSIKKGDFKGNNEVRNKKEGISYTAKLITFTCVISIIYALLFERIGFVLSTIFFLEAILFAVNGKSQWRINTIVAVSFSVGVYVIFSKFLGIMLPVMPFFYI